MGWERRGKRQYYYYKRRDGEHVVSQYAGCGPVGEAIATLQAADRRVWEGLREAARQTKAQDAAIDAAIDAAAELVRALTAATLLANGYHTHKRQWRRCKDGR